MEQKRKQQSYHFLVPPFYNAQEDFLVCPAGQN